MNESVKAHVDIWRNIKTMYLEGFLKDLPEASTRRTHS
jgi:hypothetical protein